MPRSDDRGTIAGPATIAGISWRFRAKWLPVRALRRRRRRGMEDQPETVDAVAQSGRLRTVVEDVAEMAAATPAMHLGAEHAESAVLGLADIALNRLAEPRPARATLEFGVGGAKRQVAACARRHPPTILLQHRDRARA